MEVEPSHKNTEVGIIPGDWDVRLLKELADIQRGASPRPIDAPIWYDRTSKVGWVRISDVSASDGKHLRSTRDYLSEKGILQSRYLPAGNLIMSICATVGMPVITQINSCYHDGFVGFTKLRYVDQSFLYYKLKELEPIFKLMGQTGSQNNLNTDLVRNCPISLPPILEQHLIAAALSDVDTLLAALDAFIGKMRLVKHGAMQELLLGKKRLPGFGRKVYKPTDVGALPDDWDVMQLGELFEITSSKRVFQSEWKTDGIPFYRARELAVLSEKGSVKNELFISKEMYRTYKNIYGVPKIGDMLVTGVGTLGKLYIVSNDFEFYFKDGNIIWFKTSEKVNSEFLRQLYLTPQIIKQIEDGSAGTTVGTYTISGAKKTTIPFPSLAEQRAIAEILSDMDAEIAMLEQKREKTRLLKQGMMQELLTGRIRLL